MVNYIVKQQIFSGMSHDLKYVVIVPEWNMKKCFLRISDYSSRKENNYLLINYMYKNQQISKLITVFVNDNKIYAFFEYIDGIILKDIINKIDNYQKYKFGIQAGNILNYIHTKKNNLTKDDISNKNMINMILKKYQNFSHKCLEADIIYNLIKSNKQKIDYNDYVYLNSDFHWMNMIVKKDKIYLIDLEKYEYGNRHRDFSFIYTCDEDRIFASGIINGYFGKRKIPKKFWIQFKYFSLAFVLKYYMWNIEKKGKVENGVIIIKKILNDYSENRLIPIWFINNFEVTNEKK